MISMQCKVYFGYQISIYVTMNINLNYISQFIPYREVNTPLLQTQSESHREIIAASFQINTK
jgi:hypothetical protein